MSTIDDPFRSISAPSATESGYAGWFSRVGANLVDAVVAGVVLAIMLVIIKSTHQVTATINFYTGHETVHTPLWVWPALILPSVLCLAIPMCRRGEHNGQTIGKQIARIQVVRDNGKAYGPGTFLRREVFAKGLGGILAALLHPLAPLAAVYVFIDDLAPLVDGQNRALHDRISGTHVVKRDR